MELEKEKAFEHSAERRPPRVLPCSRCKVQPLLKQRYRVPLISSHLCRVKGPPGQWDTKNNKQGKEGCPPLACWRNPSRTSKAGQLQDIHGQI